MEDLLRILQMNDTPAMPPDNDHDPEIIERLLAYPPAKLCQMLIAATDDIIRLRRRVAALEAVQT